MPRRKTLRRNERDQSPGVSVETEQRGMGCQRGWRPGGSGREDMLYCPQRFLGIEGKGSLLAASAR
jgi:hypothetical protein